MRLLQELVKEEQIAEKKLPGHQLERQRKESAESRERQVVNQLREAAAQVTMLARFFEFCIKKAEKGK
jgi:hypothetical protein